VETKRNVVAELKRLTGNRNIKWPSGIGLVRTSDGYGLHLSQSSTCGNMQSNASAFDGWALALKAWLSEDACRTVEIKWDPPQDPCDRHYQRLLYRIIRFRASVSWLRVAASAEKHLEESRVLFPNGDVKTRALYLNRPGNRPPKDTTPLPSEEKDWTEHGLELEFLKAKALLSAIGWVGTVNRQLPVGVFKERVADDTYIFTGKKSAVDLWACDPNKKLLGLFELKRPGNSQVGAISELLFYSFVIRDLLDGVFSYETRSSKARESLNTEFLNSQGIGAFLLVRNLHPLLDRARLFTMLNRSLSSRGIHFGVLTYDGHLQIKRVY